MQAYLGGQQVTFTIPLVDFDGVPITATGASYRVIDQDEVELVAKVAVTDFSEGDEGAVVIVSGLLNTLPTGVTRAMRLIEVYLTTEVGTIKLESGYLIEAEEVLVEGENSFLPYPKAMFLSYEIPNLPNWSAASRDERIAALIAARRNIGRLRFRLTLDAYQSIIDNTVAVSDLTLATVDQWNAMPVSFKEAVRRAQILEANFLLEPSDSVSAFRRDGLMSMTVGEAKQFFRPSAPIDGAVCKRAAKELSKYVLTRTMLTRS